MSADRTRHARWLPLIGVALVLLGLWMLGSNERTAAAWHRGMTRPGGDVQVLGATATSAVTAHGQRVLVSGMPKVVEPPRDTDFGVRADTPVLVRRVEMFQWHEEHAGGQVSYEQNWIDHAVDSRRFRHRAGHANTQPFPFASRRFQAAKVRLGRYVLAPAIVRALPGALQMLEPDFNDLPANLQASFQVHDGMLTTSSNPRHPRLGDLRVTWLVRPLQDVTVVARVDGDELVPAPGPGPGEGFEVQVGSQSLTDVFPDLPLPLHGAWAWRVGALVLAWLGVWLVALHWCRPRAALPVALAVSVALLGALAGIMWLGTAWVVAVIAWAVAFLAALGAWQGWRRLA